MTQHPLITEPIPDGSQVVILAGGQGTRLKDRTVGLPKPMVPLLGVPLLQHQIELCRQHGFTRIALLVHYQHEIISSYFGDGSAFGVRLIYHVEVTPRGTAGALRDALPSLDGRFLVLYGDTYLDIDLRAMWKAHGNGDAQCTLFLHPNDHPQDSDLVEVDGSQKVVCIHPYPHPPELICRNLVNAALYVFEKQGLDEFLPSENKGDLAKQTFPMLLQAGRFLRAYVSPEYVKDMGTPERLDKVSKDINSGLATRLSSRDLREAVFLDRDGTLNHEVGHLKDSHQFKLLPGVAPAIRDLNQSGLLTVVITNQPVVARGELSWEGLSQIHGHMDHLLGQEHAYLDRVYICPHHPHRGFAGEISELKQKCQCRKPDTLLFDTACRDLGIDRSKSWFIGDTTSDIEAGRRAGLRTILVRTGYQGRDGKYTALPNYVSPHLKGAVEWILYGHPNITRQLLNVVAKQMDERLYLIGGASRTGKSSAAQVLKELLAITGRRAHILSLDGWLKSPQSRIEGEGILSRYDLVTAQAFLTPLLDRGRLHTVAPPRYDPATRNSLPSPLPIAVSPDDALILEGVPALLWNGFITATAARIHLIAPEKWRLQRLREDYAWRGLSADAVESVINSRLIDEIPQVEAGRAQAAYELLSGSPHDC